MPSRKNSDGTYRDIAHPINAEFRTELEEAVLAAYREALENAANEETTEATEE
jgi:stage V sporulation protein G